MYDLILISTEASPNYPQVHFIDDLSSSPGWSLNKGFNENMLCELQIEKMLSKIIRQVSLVVGDKYDSHEAVDVCQMLDVSSW